MAGKDGNAESKRRVDAGFNPAFLVSYDENGRQYLHLGAKMQWLQFKYPGWRVVSDGMDVFSYEYFDENGEKRSETILLGHVGVLDSEGVRILSVPSSVAVNETGGDCAQEFFEKGAELALDALGLTPNNITEAQWGELRGIRKRIPNETSETSDGNGMPEEHEVPVVELPLTDDDALKVALEIFQDIVIYYGEEIDSYRPGEKVGRERILELFDDYCRSRAGTSWNGLSPTSRRKLVQNMEKRVKEAVNK